MLEVLGSVELCFLERRNIDYYILTKKNTIDFEMVCEKTTISVKSSNNNVDLLLVFFLKMKKYKSVLGLMTMKGHGAELNLQGYW